MSIITSFIKKELSYFQNLSKEGQHMLTSISLYNTMDPLIWTFVVAFLWRLSNSITLIASYYIAIFIGLIIGFFINGTLLNKFSSPRLYMIGCIAQACIVALLVFFSFKNYFLIMSLGVIFGTAAGFFWANRNFLTLRVTQSHDRIYFTSLETTCSMLTNLIIPSLAGGFIILGSKIHLYTAHTAYEILGVIIIGVMTYTGILAKNVDVHIPPIHHVTLRKASNTWNILRLFSYITGIFSGVDLVLPTILILTFLGNEGTLGLLQSISSVISAVVLYYVGKKASNKHRIVIFGLSVFCAVLGWGIFGVTYSALGVLMYMICIAFGDPFRWISINPITYDITDHEQSQQNQHYYAYIFDQELFLNLGRISALLLFIFLLIFFKTIALRVSPFFFACSQIILFFLATRMEKILGTFSHLQLPQKESEITNTPIASV